MTRSIELNDYPRFDAAKIDDLVQERLLAAELVAAKLAVPKHFPDSAVGDGRAFPKRASEVGVSLPHHVGIPPSRSLHLVVLDPHAGGCGDPTQSSILGRSGLQG